ncbi:MAG: tetratricopeptide repeat protein [Alphaproteobacteria bacterium]
MNRQQAVCIAVGWSLAVLAGTSAFGAPETAFSDLPSAQAYEQCLGLARSDPTEAFEAAIDWRDTGGGMAAQHCTAVALAEMGQFQEAATRLEKIADKMTGFAPQARAAVVGQAGAAWWQAGRTARAYGALTTAITLDPDNVDLLITRGEVLASAANFWEALDDFNDALEQAPGRVDALIFRAAAYRYVDALDLARDDLERALALDGDNPDALVERGIVRRLDGDGVGARADWMRILRVAPGSPAADVARDNIALMDVRAR